MAYIKSWPNFQDSSYCDTTTRHLPTCLPSIGNYRILQGVIFLHRNNKGAFHFPAYYEACQNKQRHHHHQEFSQWSRRDISVLVEKYEVLFIPLLLLPSLDARLKMDYESSRIAPSTATRIKIWFILAGDRLRVWIHSFFYCSSRGQYSIMERIICLPDSIHRSFISKG